ncbi:ribbon-helix-helix protein, CopG family [Mesorhizobium sp. B292B1B]|uniref:ribbon-helix-helix protein, CopG family n=1 Tax=unclassified Mesorhizobium TaxID=325217 RepID=UPI0015E46D62|nr:MULTISPECIES: ribbon-helix-helix protein, CopG family [unclassified Mesorhizobium]MCA0015567.1 ribbon-helix-helix protein, CopG family [Mesorhizobium sp. B294B1A1]MCA0041367.1 ribbon-helix-helix protein, CopG family [Mesorhizobium sp. B292B1B]
MARSTQQKRFTVSVDQADYDALRELAETQKPPLNLQYLLRLAIKNLLEQHTAKQLSFPLDR